MADRTEFKIGVLAGDGIGPEITDAAIEALQAASERRLTGLPLTPKSTARWAAPERSTAWTYLSRPLPTFSALKTHVEADRHVGKVVIRIKGHRSYDAGLRSRGGESSDGRAIGLRRATGR